MSVFYFLNHYFLKLAGKANLVINKPKNAHLPTTSFYDFKFKTIDGRDFLFSSLKGKKILIVNTASKCGYTKQYKDLEQLYQQCKEKLVVIGFPANDFLRQESGNNTEIGEFCKKNFGVSFPLMEKSSVKGSDKNEIYKWLCSKSKNGWNTQQPKWNFAKYLISENGELLAFFGSALSPMSDEIVSRIKS